jgi:mannose-6-phosphate isomerase-like protein (cupin superfamily)
MPVYRTSEVPPASALTFSAFGYYSCPRGGEVNVEPHFHDAGEYWFICAGRVRVMTEGQKFELGPAGCVFTAMGNEHECWGVRGRGLVLA